MQIHTVEKPYDKSIHTGEEPYIYDIIIASLIKNPVHKSYFLPHLLVKMNYFVHLVTKLFLIKCLNHLRLFCSVKLMLVFISEQHLMSSWLRILGIQLRFWNSLVHVERLSIIPLTSLCYNLSWSGHQNAASLVQLGCK